MTSPTPTTETVEALVRRQLSVALGGKRGMAEAAVPTLTFTVFWLAFRHLELALGASIAVAVLELGLRLVQRQTVKFVVNALVGIAIGWFFVHLAASRGGKASSRMSLPAGVSAPASSSAPSRRSRLRASSTAAAGGWSTSRSPGW